MDKTPGQARKQLVDQLESALLSLNKIATRRLFEGAGLTPIEFAEEIFVPALERIGTGWEKGEVALSQVYMSGRICEDLLDEFITAGAEEPRDHPPMAIAVLMDYHMLGKRIVCSVLRASGFDLLDYGQVTVDDLVNKVRDDGIRILLVSTLMLSSALQVRHLRERLDAAGLDVKLVVGGVPFRFDDNLWREVGADATSPTAAGVVGIVKNLIGAMT
ncbi:MAG TPA: cobalamin-dependent protein [Dongiaceae bacterium]|nr:cobalamin-dependent protein [Dongiaceae bacterium]